MLHVCKSYLEELNFIVIRGFAILSLKKYKEKKNYK